MTLVGLDDTCMHKQNLLPSCCVAPDCSWNQLVKGHLARGNNTPLLPSPECLHINIVEVRNIYITPSGQLVARTSWSNAAAGQQVLFVHAKPTRVKGGWLIFHWQQKCGYSSAAEVWVLGALVNDGFVVYCNKSALSIMFTFLRTLLNN